MPRESIKGNEWMELWTNLYARKMMKEVLRVIKLLSNARASMRYNLHNQLMIKATFSKCLDATLAHLSRCK